MSLLKAFNNLQITRSYVSARSLHPKKFTSILNNVPARPRNPWQIFLRENMHKYKNENGKIDLKVATKDLGGKWKTLSDNEKEAFTAIYRRESEEFVTKMDQALKNATPKQFHTENALRKKYKLTLLKDPSRPKRPKNNFLFYVEHLRATNDPAIQNVLPKDQVVIAAKKFKTLSESEAKVYKDKAKAASEQYQKDNAAYNQSTK